MGRDRSSSSLVLRAALVVALAFFGALPASAQEDVPPETPPFPITASSLRGGVELSQVPLPQRSPFARPLDIEAPERPSALLPLYGSLIALQGLDFHSTRTAIASGGTEANPAMRPFVENSAAFVAVKAGATAGVIWASEKLWQKKHRKAAVVFATLVNAAMAAVVANNYRVSR